MNYKDTKNALDTLAQIDGADGVYDLIEWLAAQNEALRDALETAKLAMDKSFASNGEDYKLLRGAMAVTKNALATPNVGAEILRKRDAQTLRKAAEEFAGPSFDISYSQVYKQLMSMAEELEKAE